MNQQPFPVSAPSVLLVDVYVFQIETALSPESREVMEEQSEPYGSPVQLAQYDFRLSFFKKGFAERLLGRIHFALELFVAGHFHDESVNRGRVFRPGRADVQFVHR